jgi:hypothetical protein
MWYTISDAGNGELIRKGDVVRLAYTLTLLDGTPCYSSKEDGPKEFLVGQGGVESGIGRSRVDAQERCQSKIHIASPFGAWLGWRRQQNTCPIDHYLRP